MKNTYLWTEISHMGLQQFVPFTRKFEKMINLCLGNRLKYLMCISKCMFNCFKESHMVNWLVVSMGLTSDNNYTVGYCAYRNLFSQSS